VASVDSLAQRPDFDDAVALRTKHEDAKQNALRRISEISHLGKVDFDEKKSEKIDENSVEEADAIAPVQVLPTIVDENTTYDPMATAHRQHEKDVTIVKPVGEEKDVKQATVEEVQVVVQPVQRIDYLAGFTALACIGVTLHHFGQTFW
jgi:protein-tyrosine-phosphatase